jgi:hypothetical protein
MTTIAAAANVRNMRVIICENGAENTVFSTPSANAFDALSSLTSAGVYMIVALAALAQAPHDARVRVFLAVALAGVAPYWITAQVWVWGWGAALTKSAVVFVVLSLMMGSLALFHFTQVFPWRRPWIRANASRLWVGYLVIPSVTGLIAFLTPSFNAGGATGFGAVSHGATLLLVLAGAGLLIAIVFVLGILVPFAGLLSLYKSYVAARSRGIESARRTTWMMLVSQLGGGVLTILVVPLMRIVVPAGPWVTIASVLLFACAMLMPLAFALGVWRLHILELDIDALPQ